MICKNHLKIIGGIFKGKKIKILKDKSTKPTLVGIRKTLFDWLNPFIKNFICLDCFAGSGILSLESISRRAKHVTVIEKKYKTFKNIKKNFKKIKKKKYSIINIDIFTWLKKKKKKKFDLIFIDAPYKNKNINLIIKLIEKNNFLKKKSFIYIETYKKNKLLNIPKKWILYKKKHTQNIKYKLFIKK